MITHDLVTEFEVHHFVTFATDIGLKPGEWPRNLPTDIGNGQDFLVASVGENGQWVNYIQMNGCVRLRVFND